MATKSKKEQSPRYLSDLKVGVGVEWTEGEGGPVLADFFADIKPVDLADPDTQEEFIPLTKPSGGIDYAKVKAAAELFKVHPELVCFIVDNLHGLRDAAEGDLARLWKAHTESNSAQWRRIEVLERKLGHLGDLLVTQDRLVKNQDERLDLANKRRQFLEDQVAALGKRLSAMQDTQRAQALALRTLSLGQLINAYTKVKIQAPDGTDSLGLEDVLGMMGAASRRFRSDPTDPDTGSLDDCGGCPFSGA